MVVEEENGGVGMIMMSRSRRRKSEMIMVLAGIGMIVYEVIVGAFNPNGSGPNSTAHEVISAEYGRGGVLLW